MTEIYSFSVLGFSFGVTFIAVLALFKRKDIISVRFLIFSVLVASWGFLFAFWVSQRYSDETSLRILRTAHLFAVFIPIAWCHFVFQFIDKKAPKLFYIIWYSISILLLFFIPTNHFITGLQSAVGIKQYTEAGPVYLIHATAFFILVPYSFVCILKAFRNSKGRYRNQLKHIIVATAMGFTAGGTTFLPIYGIPVPLYLLPLMLFYPIFMGIALIRYGLFDAEKIADSFQREKLAAIGTLSASINHEIKNPLYVVQGLTQSHLSNLQDRIYSDEKQELQKSREIIEKSAHQVERAMEIMRKFSHFAKRQVKASTEAVNVDLHEALNNVLPLIRHEMELDKIEFEEKIEEGLTLYADPRHIEEILFNLIFNACQAMKTGGKIQVTGFKKASAVELIIRDNGPGVAEEHLKHIFEPFYTTKETGTGLGLYITKQLVEKNGGTISIKSEQGKGTTVTASFSGIDENLMETQELLSRPGFSKSIKEARQDIRHGRTKPLKDLFEE